MKEQLLQFIWQYKLFDKTKVIATTNGTPIQIIKVGHLNTNAGPDFTEARITIGDATWVGDVELHVQASDWIAHKHSQNPAYDKVIAHVVFEANTIIKDKLGNEIPTICLEAAVDDKRIDQYEKLMQQSQPLACSGLIQNVPEIIWLQQSEKMLTERLIAKAQKIIDLLEHTANDWSEVFYISIARSFGTNINGDAFEAAAIRLPIRTLSRQKNNLDEITAMLLGTSGMLMASKSEDDYIKLLQQIWVAMRAKYQLQSMDATRFKMAKMRPPNFPTIRLAQLAQLIFNSEHLLSKVINCNGDIQLLKSLLNVAVAGYWSSHYTLTDEAASIPKPKQLGDTQVTHILINTIAPALYAFGIQQGKNEFCQMALQILMQLPAEDNKITRVFSSIGLPNNNANQSQAMIQLFNNYCSVKKCLSCSIGYSVIKG
jgi:hypothetical protein